MLPDYLRSDLDVVFVGTSVATASAARGHYYSGPGNKFWELLWQADLTGERLLVPEQDSRVLEFGMGLTDLVKGRAASSDALLQRTDFDVPGFLNKIREFEPLCVAFNGREAGKRVARFEGRAEPALGLNEWKLHGAHVFVLPSSSGSSSDPKHFAPKASKADWWLELGAWLREARHRR